jgi:hypothetical protein
VTLQRYRQQPSMHGAKINVFHIHLSRASRRLLAVRDLDLHAVRY